MTALQVACQVATGYGALCGMKLHPVAVTDISRLGSRLHTGGSVLTCQRRLHKDGFDSHENVCTHLQET